MTDYNSTVELTQSDLVFLHSPLNLLAGFVLLLQERFSYGNLPWQWDSDENKTGLHIYTEYNEQTSTANASPRLIVGRGTVIHGHGEVVGDNDALQGARLTRDRKTYWGTGNTDVQVQCVSENRGEATILGDIVQTTIGMTREEICKQFTLRDIGQIALQPSKPWDRDDENWDSSVQARIFWEQRWATTPAAPKLQEVTAYTKSRIDALNYTKTFILRSDDLPAPQTP